MQDNSQQNQFEKIKMLFNNHSDKLKIVILKQLIKNQIEIIKSQNQLSSFEFSMFLQFDMILQLDQIKQFNNTEIRNMLLKLINYVFEVAKIQNSMQNNRGSFKYQVNKFQSELKCINSEKNEYCKITHNSLNNNNNYQSELKCIDSEQQSKISHVSQLTDKSNYHYYDQYDSQTKKSDLISQSNCIIQTQDGLKAFQINNIEIKAINDKSEQSNIDVIVGPNQQVQIKKYDPDLIIRQKHRKRSFFTKCLEQARQNRIKRIKLPIKLNKFDWLCQTCCNINYNYRKTCHACSSHKEIFNLIQAL